MASQMELSNWSLTFGDQLQLFDGPPTLDLPFGRSDACQDEMFDDGCFGAVERCKGVVSPAVAWPEDYGYDGLNSPSNGPQSPLVSSPDPLYASFAYPPSAIFNTKPLPFTPPPQLSTSPVPDLPSSPEEYFGDVPAFPAAGSPVASFVPGSLLVSIGNYTASVDYVTKELEMAGSFEDCMEVGDVEQDEMLFELDDEDTKNVVIDHEKLASIGPFLPSVSLDDVLSLLPPTGTTAPPASSAVVVSPCSVPPVLSPSPCPSDVTTLPIFYIGSPDGNQICFHGPLAETSATVGLPAYSPQPLGHGNSYASSMVSMSSPNSPGGESENSCSADIPDSSQSSGQLSNWESSSSSSSLVTVLISSPSASIASVSRPVPERRLRKKEQNKTAAQRYREKKRSEHGTVLSEYEVLEKRNTELRAKVDDMSKEIAYLKGLIEEICS